MQIYEFKNSLKNQLISYLLEWNGTSDWVIISHGYPQLYSDTKNQGLYFCFKSFEKIEKIRSYPLGSFRFSTNSKNSTITIENNDSLSDIALSFNCIEHCIKFKTMLIHYLQISIIKREKQ